MKRRRDGAPLGRPHYNNKVSEVIIGGIAYKSDRFYLNAGPKTKGETKPTETPPPNNDTPLNSICQCGAQSCHPPPLFDRDKLLKEMIERDELKAVVMATFTFNLQFLLDEYPQLVGPGATVPTLILHGQKGVKYINGTSAESQNALSLLLQLQEEEDTNSNDSWNPESSSSSLSPNRNEESSPITKSLGKNFHVTQVLPTSDGSIKGVTQERKNANGNRKWRGGVHHPKFLILFEKSGDLIVVVSTANLVPSATLEGSWIQRFKRYKGKPRDKTRYSPANSFGFSLADFLHQLSKASEQGGTRIDSFLKQYMDIKLGDFFGLYHFEKANVHLVPTVPGQFRIRDGFVEKYGRHRVQSILSKLQKDLHKTTKDSLIVQPTSIGQNMQIGTLAHIGKSYLNCSRTAMNNDILDRMTIIWPSWEFLATFTEKLADKRPPKRESRRPKSEVLYEKGEVEDFDCFVFLSAAAFNTLDMECVHRLAHFRTSYPFQSSSQPALTPHFKSIARICKDPTVCSSQPRKETFSWFLLTSACLSQGAQGKVEKEGTPDETISYANFELGVLFTSERAEKLSGRLYCFGPNDCTSDIAKASNLIHLPVPYSLQTDFYLKENEATMNGMPYFHEVRSADIGGNFLCTPYKKSKYLNRGKDSDNKENKSKTV